jgi:hypothetical protein
MEPKSSIHIQPGNPDDIYHDTREHETVNSIFSMDKNEVSRDAKSAISLYRRELQTRTSAYTDRTGQKLQKNVITHLSAVINLKEVHTLKDLVPVLDHLEETLDTKVVLAVVHKDEGFELGNRKKINPHAHIEMMGIDSMGQSIRKKLTRNYLIELQTIVAKLLNMQRGGGGKRKRKRLGTYEYKEAMRLLDEERSQWLVKQQKLENKLTDVKSRLQISLENEKDISKKMSAQSKDLISKEDIITKKTDENIKLNQKFKQLKKQDKKLVDFTKNVSSLFGFEIDDVSQLDELFAMVQESQKGPIIKSILDDTEDQDQDTLRKKR